MIRFEAHGIPRTQGNLQARCPRRDPSCHPVVAEDNYRPKLADGTRGVSRAARMYRWRQTVRIASRSVAPSAPFSGPVVLRVQFRLKRAASTKRAQPTGQRDGDLDKLLRAVLDALQTNVKRDPGHILEDDCQVVKVIAEKVWATPQNQPGVTIQVEPLEEEQERLI